MRFISRSFAVVILLTFCGIIAAAQAFLISGDGDTKIGETNYMPVANDDGLLYTLTTEKKYGSGRNWMDDYCFVDVLEALYNYLGDKILDFAHSSNSVPPVYYNGCLIYQASAMQTNGKVQDRYGAIDFEENMAVPFKFKSARDVIKSKEMQAYVPSEASRKIDEDARRLAEFVKVKKELDAYRESRTRASSDIITSRNNYGSKQAGVLRLITHGASQMVVDNRNNLVLDPFPADRNSVAYAYNDYLMKMAKGDSVWVYYISGRKLGDSSNQYWMLRENAGHFEWGKKGNGTVETFGWHKNRQYTLGVKDFLTEYVNRNMKLWYEKDEFETVAEFQKRTSPEMCLAAQEYFADCALQLYKELRLPDPYRLADYDRENEAFMVESPVGNVVMKVPFDESMNFRKRWETGNVLRGYGHFESTPDGSGVTLARLSLSCENDNGVWYRYLGDRSGKYATYTMAGNGTAVAAPTVDVVRNPNPVDRREYAVGSGRKPAPAPSDVDVNIPVSGRSAPSTFALVIANEDYSRLAPSEFASNDGRVFAEYCSKTLGIPESNIKAYYNATYGQMVGALGDMAAIARAYGGDVNLLVYYAGHGAPEEGTRRPFLLPVDAAGVDARTCMPLDGFYADLSAIPTRNTMVFLDACFTGHDRSEVDGQMLVSERGVEIEPEAADVPTSGHGGRMVVFSAASGRQSAIPYREMGHGLFTYFLLKKLRETLGKVTAGDLWDYLQQNVGRRSAVIGKVQTPTVSPSSSAADWRDITL